jgi:hypothetical protein
MLGFGEVFYIGAELQENHRTHRVTVLRFGEVCLLWGGAATEKANPSVSSPW